MTEFITRVLVGLLVGAAIRGVSEVADHPMPWWLALAIGLAVAFLARWIAGLIGDIIEAILS